MPVEIQDGVPAYPFATVAAFSPPERWSTVLAEQMSPRYLSRWIPKEWCSEDITLIPALVPPPPLDCGNEIRDLFSLAQQRGMWETIGAEAGDGTHFILELQRVLEAMRAPLDQEIAARKTARMLLEEISRLVLQDAGTVVLNQKALFNRPRPYQLAPALNPLFCPPHPAYPSGHATQVMTLGWVIREALRKTPYRRAGALFADYAASVGRRREVAGVHYASDTVAGHALALRIVRCYLESEDFRAGYVDPFTRHFR